MSKKKFTYESNLEKIMDRVQEKPHRVMNIIGQNLTREIRTNIRHSGSSRRGMLERNVGYWARRQEKDLQIGFKMSIVANRFGVGPGIVGNLITRQEQDPIKPVVMKNKDMIVETIGKALDEIRRE